MVSDVFNLHLYNMEEALKRKAEKTVFKYMGPTIRETSKVGDKWRINVLSLF